MSKELSSRIKELRKAKGYTQKDFANLIGVRQTTVANYESGIRIPDTDKLDKIATCSGLQLITF
jgi:transcriptional regulator with XRE-family HTH domain